MGFDLILFVIVVILIGGLVFIVARVVGSMIALALMVVASIVLCSVWVPEPLSGVQDLILYPIRAVGSLWSEFLVALG